MSRIAITSDCTCDLSGKNLEEYGVELLYSYIEIDQGCFKDSEEITAANVVEYLENGGEKMLTFSPDVEEIVLFYQRMLDKYDEIIHFSISSKLSRSYEYAAIAAERFNGSVHVIDSEQVSAGIGHMIIKAVELVRENKSTDEIVKILMDMKQKVTSTFIMENLECFYRTGRVSKFIKNICNIFQIRPVIIVKNGKLRLKDIKIGDYETSAIRYVKKTLKHVSTIDKKHIFIVHSNCKVSLISRIKQQVMNRCNFETVYITRTSATVTGNCGANTVGILYVRE